MESSQHNKIGSFIWGIADDVLRDLYVRGKYRDVILPKGRPASLRGFTLFKDRVPFPDPPECPSAARPPRREGPLRRVCGAS